MAFDLDADLRTMAKRALDLLEAGTTDLADDMWREPVDRYTDPELFAREREVLFRRTPLLMGLSCDWPEPGSFRRFAYLPDPLVIVRGDDGELRAFLNVCRHRGARLVHDEAGCARRFRCSFHSWTYDTAGTLVGLPGAAGFTGLDRSEHGLVEVPCAERDGMVWCVPAHDGELDLDAHLGALGDLFAACDLGTAERFVSHRLEDTNWKLAVDTYLEGYHFAALHPDTINTINHDDLVVLDTYGPHSRQGFPRRRVHELRAAPEDQWRVLDHITCVFQLFPNVAFTLSPEGILINQVFPGARVDHSVTVQTHYSRVPVTTDEQRATLEWRASMVRDVVRDDDYWMTASITEGLHSGANRHLTFGRNEPGLHHFHRSLAAACP